MGHLRARETVQGKQRYQGEYSMLKEWAFKPRSYEGEYDVLKEQALKELEKQSKGNFRVIKVSTACAKECITHRDM